MSESKEFIFNVEGNDTFYNVEIGYLTVVGKGDTSFIYSDDINTVVDEEYLEDEFAGEEETLFQIAAEMEIKFELQNGSLNDTTPDPASMKNFDIDYSNTGFVGDVWKNYNIDTLINNINKTKYRVDSKFKESLKKTLFFIKNDSLVKEYRHASYLLGTAFVESGYSLQRWEADFSCRGIGIPYVGSPCEKAINYFRSSNKKKNYFLLGTDSNGLPYFGRGLIQLTGKDNYSDYGRKIGVNLVANGDKALDPQNSYKIAVQYMKSRTFRHVDIGDFFSARKSVNGRGDDKQLEVNGAYNEWNKIFYNSWKESSKPAVT